ncbi:MAG: BrnA antitoxin family protein [Gemmatimonadales bacterium]|nr:BrnA antitoxin family protein [Gemmatimonadales bacterium]
MDAMTEKDIERTSPPELANLPADFWDGAKLVLPISKQAVSLRVDRDVLDWFKKQGPRYQSRMNAVLRSYMSRSGQARRANGKRTSSR